MRLGKVISLIAGTFIVFSCSRHFVNAEYVLEKKYPLETPSMKVNFLTDSTGVITNEEDRQSQKFSFRYGKHFMVITSIEKPNFVSLENGDTIVYHKDKLYLFDKSQKLIFSRKD